MTQQLITVETARTFYTPHDPISERTIRQWLADGRLPRIRGTGRRVYIRPADLARVLGLSANEAVAG